MALRLLSPLLLSFMLGLFYLVKREFIGAIAFIALIIMRFYFDTFYDFMPKSLFFVIGGAYLLVLVSIWNVCVERGWI